MRNQSYYAFLFNLNVDMENAAIMKMKGNLMRKFRGDLQNFSSNGVIRYGVVTQDMYIFYLWMQRTGQ